MTSSDFIFSLLFYRPELVKILHLRKSSKIYIDQHNHANFDLWTLEIFYDLHNLISGYPWNYFGTTINIDFFNFLFQGILTIISGHTQFAFGIYIYIYVGPKIFQWVHRYLNFLLTNSEHHQDAYQYDKLFGFLLV